MIIVSITHPTTDHARYFAEDDLERLRDSAEVRVLGDLDQTGQDAALAQTEILLGSWGMPRLDATFLARAPRLRAVCYAAGSVKGFATPESYARGVRITTAMQANAVPVAEVTVALITLANKSWFQAIDMIKAQRKQVSGPLPAHPGNYRTRVGLIGYGAICRLVARKLHDMDLLVDVYDPFAKDEDLAACRCRRQSDLLQLARDCQVISLHAPSIPATRHMLAAPFFRAMRDGATFINTARGALVDEPALIAELQTGRITAHLDVTDPEPPVSDSPLWHLPNVYLTPHLAGSSSGEIRRMGHLAIEECLRIIRGEQPRYLVTEAMLATMA
jgi:phosphoglycerate dehydrogenase-like enzyme